MSFLSLSMKTQVGKAILSFFSWTLKKKIVKNESRISERSGKEVAWWVKVNNSRTPIVTLRLNSRSELSIKRTFSIRNLSEEREHTKTDIVVGRINHSGPFLRELYLYSVHTVCRCAAEVGTALKMNKELPYLFLILGPLFVRRWKSRHGGGGGKGGGTPSEKKNL